MTIHNIAQPSVSPREPFEKKRYVAELYGFTTRWVDLKVAEGMPVHRFGNRVRFRMSEVEAFLSGPGA